MLTYATVSTVCASSLLGRLVDLDVLDDEVAGVETFGVGVGFGVAEETEEEFGRLDWPASFGDTECFACSTMMWLASKSRIAVPPSRPPSFSRRFLRVNFSPGEKGLTAHPVQSDQCYQHISSSVRLPCAPSRSRGR